MKTKARTIQHHEISKVVSATRALARSDACVLVFNMSIFSSLPQRENVWS
jgi:hypothetical protein